MAQLQVQQQQRSGFRNCLSRFPLPFLKRSQSIRDTCVRTLANSILTLESLDTTNISDEDHQLQVAHAASETSLHIKTVLKTLFETEALDLTNHKKFKALKTVTSNMIKYNLIFLLVKILPKLEFEARKDVVLIFSNFLRRFPRYKSPAVSYISSKPEILMTLLESYACKDITFLCGDMLREAIYYEKLGKYFLNMEVIDKLFDYIQGPGFVLSSDAFKTLEKLLVKNPMQSSKFLCEYQEQIFGRFSHILQCGNFATIRITLELLIRIFLTTTNFVKARSYFVASDVYLKIIMNLLNSPTDKIGLNSFHLFKLFVMNPEIPDNIKNIIVRNNIRIAKLLESFTEEKQSEKYERFQEDRAVVLKRILELKNSDNNVVGTNNTFAAYNTCAKDTNDSNNNKKHIKNGTLELNLLHKKETA